MEEYKYTPTNREKSRRTVTGYKICYDCEGRRPKGCENCNWEKQHARAMKYLNKVKKRDNI